jgi:hypothetical protein
MKVRFFAFKAIISLLLGQLGTTLVLQDVLSYLVHVIFFQALILSFLVLDHNEALPFTLPIPLIERLKYFGHPSLP